MFAVKRLFCFTEDGDLLKLALGRLTSHSTFPNVILHGKSLGGADNVQALHDEGHLKPILEEGGVKVLGDLHNAQT